MSSEMKGKGSGVVPVQQSQALVKRPSSGCSQRLAPPAKVQNTETEECVGAISVDGPSRNMVARAQRALDAIYSCTQVEGIVECHAIDIGDAGGGSVRAYGDSAFTVVAAWLAKCDEDTSQCVGGLPGSSL